MSTVRGKLELLAGKYEQFHPSVAENLVGKLTSNGWTIVSATNKSPELIEAIIEKEI